MGKPVEYTVPVNEIGATDDQLQAFLQALCYNHQIVGMVQDFWDCLKIVICDLDMSVSLPEPIYQADELAKRGRNNFKAMK